MAAEVQNTQQTNQVTPQPIVQQQVQSNQPEGFVTTDSGKKKSRFGLGKFVGVFSVLLLLAGVIAGVVLVGQPQNFIQRASTVIDSGHVNNLSGCSSLEIDPAAKAYCNSFCINDNCNLPSIASGTCEIRRFHSNDNNDPVVNDTQTGFVNSAGGKLGFEQSCGAEQIDVGCYTDELNHDGVYNDGFKTVAYAWRRYGESCGTSPTSPPTGGGDLPQANCEDSMVCVPKEYWDTGGDKDGQYDNCGEVGRPGGPGEGNQCGDGGYCCGPTGTKTPPQSTPQPTPTPKAVCGEGCSVDSDCGDSTLGVPVVCREGQCVNQTCYNSGGDTVFGSRCDCQLPNACGAPCGSGIGLCDEGYSCTYAAQSTCGGNGQGICVPRGTEGGRGPMTDVPLYDGSAFERMRCGETTTDPENSFIYHPSFPNHVFTSAEVLEYICNPTAPTTAPSPTAAPDIGAQCLDIRVYDTSWNRLTVAQMQELQPGDTIRLSVAGNTNLGFFSKARFTINNEKTPRETTQRDPHVINSIDGFYLDYIIPTGTTGLTIKGELYHANLGWL